MEYLQKAVGSVIAVAPKVLLFLVILVVGWIVARLLLNLLARLLNRVGFDRAVERGGIQRWLGDNQPSQLAAKLVYYAVLLIALQLAFGVFGPNPVSRIIDAIVGFLPLAFVAVVIIVITAAIANAVKDVVTSALGGLSYGRALGTIAQVFILGLGIIAALNQIGIALTVTLPVLVAILATIGGVIVVGAGGGLIQPMRHRWERWLARSEAEMDVVRSQMSQSEDRTRQMPTTAGAPQPAYTSQGSGAAVDPTHPREAQPATQPEMAQPGAVPPGTAQPGTAAPGTPQPGTAQPGSVPPGTAQPGTYQSGTATGR